ncbi:MAG: indolepyruvate oxidoreductase subunit beta [Deltaproteobacteria bacterium]|nr:indolepyruvate oxidoreductase subunit beta [Deltaproteobacteria bacterium]
MTLPIKRLKLLIAGVGGQGALTAARFLGEAALSSGMPVIVGQLHGMSQRGGSVECSVIFGKGYSPHIGEGEADVVLGLEPLEVKRALPKISKHTKIVLNLGKIVPLSLAIAGKSYPPLEGILEAIREVTPHLFEIDGPGLVKQTGLPRALNVALLGALVGLEILPFGREVLWQAIVKKIPPRFLEANRQAFELGISATHA